MNRPFSKNRVLLLGLLTVVVPLGLLLAMQYRALTSLQKNSALAEISLLDNYLDFIGAEVEYFYRSEAERSLNISPDLFQQGEVERLTNFFKYREPSGKSQVFLARFASTESWGKILTWDPESERIGPPTDPSTFEAISVAVAPWRTLAEKGASIQTLDLHVDEMDPSRPIILLPISDETCRLIGVAGLIVDGGFFRDQVLPRAVGKARTKFLDHQGRENLLLTVRDPRGRRVYGDRSITEEATRTGKIPFIFSEWKVEASSRLQTPQQLAHSNFVINISLTVFLVGILLGGLWLALRTISRELRLTEMKSDFVSNVSHELRTPLASIRVFGEFLRRGRTHEPETTRKYGEYIETESSRLTALINNILDFSKIESGAKTYEMTAGDLRVAVSQTLQELTVRLDHQAFELRSDLPVGEFPFVDFDADAINQALTNLIDNAVKYSADNRRIDVAVKRRAEHVLLSVHDNGIGISRDEQTKIFERFHRVGTGLVHDVKGSGLGLSIVHHVVSAHGGRVTVESELEQGSTFTIELPISATHEVDTKQPLAIDEPFPQAGSS
ncbi:MAG: HAMP domain-containing histidine kinase [Acidobacteriota bacterium]|nr:HAMP domain-containing histidine kinase [Acidobacteriota bacterium]MDH3784700.1 HAMP domain-containing histidine kinase [Acidobacteriota bacterium]